MKIGIIYLITNKVNGKKYVGKTVRTLKTRWYQHVRDASHGCDGALQCAIRKYGKKSFTVEIIAESLEPFLDALERMFIKLHCSRTEYSGYNMTDGGDGMCSPSAEARRKMSAAKKGKKLSDEHKAKISKASKGRLISPDTKRKMSLAQSGKECSPEMRAHLQRIGTQQAKKNVGVALSAERKAKIGAAQKGRVVPFERRAKISNSLKGNKNHFGKAHSEATRQKLREAWARRKQRAMELSFAA
jgi:group I intron endonuclease